ncbi:MAG: RNA methyltransferase [Granulosicoccaceae bacterium]
MPNYYTAIGLQNPKSPTNVGSVMRAAGCYSVDAVFYTGTRYDRAASFQTDTHQISSRIPLQCVEDMVLAVPEQTRIVCVELVQGAQPLPSYAHPERALFLFGPEDGSLDQSIVDRADDVVYVPTEMCMNLAASVNVLLYDRLAKTGRGADRAIEEIRDTNNRLKIS